MAYPISDEARTLFMNNYPQSARITMNDGNRIIYITEADIEQGGLSVNRYSATGSCIELGSAVAAELSLTLSNYDGKFNNVTFEGAELYVEVSVFDPNADEGGMVQIHYVPLGYFIVEGCPRKLQTISITALDRMVKFDKPVNNARLGFPTTAGGLLDLICSICGVELATVELLNSDYEIPTAPQNSDATYRQYLQWIAQITGTCAFIDWEGKLRLEWYRLIRETITPAMRYSSDIYENPVTVGGVSVSGSSALHIFSDNEYMLKIEGNGLIQSAPTEIGEVLYNRFKGFTYTPFSAVVQPMPHLWPLDMVKSVDAEEKEHTCIITDVTFSLNRNTAISGRGDTATEREHSEHIAFTGGIINSLMRPNELSAEQIVGELTGKIPTKTSQLTNDAGFVTINHAHADGSITPAMTTFIDRTGETTEPRPLFKNWLPISTDDDGAVFNGIGYRENGRIGSDGNEGSMAGMYVTGFIPCKLGDVIRFGGIDMKPTASNATNQRISFYDSNKTHIGQTNASAAVNVLAAVTGSDENISQLKVQAWNAVPGMTDTAYMRFCCTGIDASSAVAVNEEIAYESVSTFASMTLDEDIIVPLAVLNAAKIAQLERPEGSVAPKMTTFIDCQEAESEQIPLFKNWLPVATDADGAVFNSKGYKENGRLGSNGLEGSMMGMYVTGFIPCKKDDIIRFNNINMKPADSNATNQRISYYDSAKTHLGQTNAATAVNTMGAIIGSDGNISELTIKKWNGFSAIDSVAYLRFCCAGIDASSAVAINEDIEYEFVSTIASMTLDKDIIVPLAVSNADRITLLENSAGLSRVPAFVRTAAEAVAETVKSRQNGKSITLAFLSDMHLGYYSDPDYASMTHAMQALEAISETCHMDAIIFGGDYSNGALTNTKAITFTELNEASKLIHGVAPGVPQLWLKGNHDDAPYMSTANRLTADESYTRIGIRNTLCDAVIDPSCPNGNYGYKDFPAQRIRVIYLNTDDKAAFESAEAQTSSDTGYLNAHHLSAGQIGWLINTALDFSDKAAPLQWGIIVCSHVNLNVSGTYTCGNTSYSYSTANAATILDAYESGLSGSVTVDGESIEYDFSSGNFAAGKRAHIVCVIHGHDHALLNVRLGMNQFHSIGCPNVMNGRERVSADGNTYTKTADTANDTAFTMITVDRAAKKVYADCYGAGYDRVFDY